jgi:hypothetical protein
VISRNDVEDADLVDLITALELAGEIDGAEAFVLKLAALRPPPPVGSSLGQREQQSVGKGLTR